MSDTTDPIDSLVRFVEEIKPFHSKVIEVLTEYVYTEELNVTLSEKSILDVGIVINRYDESLDAGTSDRFGGNYDTDYYDSAQYYPVIAFNTTQPDGAFSESKKGYNADDDYIIIPGDQTAVYRVGREIVIDLIRHNTKTGDDEVTSTTYTIDSSAYVTIGQTNGISDTPHTRIGVIDLLNESDLDPLEEDEIWTANATLRPVTVKSVVTSNSKETNTDRVKYSSTPLLGPPEKSSSSFEPDEDTEYGDENVTRFDNYIILEEDATGSYPYGSKILLELDNGERTQYTVSQSYYLTDEDHTIVEILEELVPSANYSNAKAVEAFFGYSEEFVRTSSALPETPEGLTQTYIAENITFSWNDGNEEVLDFTQFVIKEVKAGNVILIASDGREPTDFINVGDIINVVESEASINGKHSISKIEPVADGTEITVNSTLNTSTDVGFLETT